MPKQKSHKGILKRVKVGAKGKVKCRQVGRGHLLSHKSSKRKRKLRRTGVLAPMEARKIHQLLGHR